MMFAFWSDLILRTLQPVLARTPIDVVIFAEDLAYKSAPHVSPKLYREFWLPYQDPIVAELKRFGVPLISMWSAGNLGAVAADADGARLQRHLATGEGGGHGSGRAASTIWP